MPSNGALTILLSATDPSKGEDDIDIDEDEDDEDEEEVESVDEELGDDMRVFLRCERLLSVS